MAEVPPPQEGGANSTTATTTQEAEEGFNYEQVMEREGNNLVLPEDGYEWKKYGQKFIRTISKTRSYFKCRRPGCSAKKKAEWSHADANNIQITYGEPHSHAPIGALESSSSQAASVVIQYDLYNQVLRHQNSPS